MTNKDLDRYAELDRLDYEPDYNYILNEDEKKELESLKAQLEGELEKAEKYNIHGINGCQAVWNEKLKVEQENKQLKEEVEDLKIGSNNLRNHIVSVEEENNNLKQKLEKIKKWFTKNDNKGIGNKDWQELKEILEVVQ